MEIAIKIIIGIVALFHVYVMWLEMFAWTTKGPKTFKNFDKDLFPKTKSLAANQGLYNGFLAAGLIWSFFLSNPETQFNVQLFFLACVAIAGIYGAVTADKKIFFFQGLPALTGIVLLLFVPKQCDNNFPDKSDSMIQSKKNIGKNSEGVYLIDSKGQKLSETFPIQANNKTDFSDSLFLSVTFRDELNRPNELKFYGPSKYALGNKDAFKVTLNNWGVIYSENPRMENYVLLKSTDETINNIISLALINILKHKKNLVEKIMRYKTSLHYKIVK